MLNVLITGASAGIGRATAIRLATGGATIALCARRADRLDQVAAEIRAAGGEALPVVADVTNAAEMQAFVDRALAQLGRLDVAICNAGFGIYGTIEMIGAEQMQRLLDVNFMGTYNTARAVVPLFRQRGRGHLIIVSSIAGKRGIPYMGAYSATKFAQVGLAESLRAELEESGIHVSIVFPVSTDTEFFEVMTGHSGFATRAAGPRQTAADVADAIARTIARPAAEVYPYRKARGLSVLNALAPGFTDRIVKRWGRRPI
ncbi:MAG: SDR family NAD(P)-dependent oxidoreductase [Luteitalea sp.]|nr:SDR family NAD(P)-dependent oxidoreductase [Luteitalea sp.]